MVTTSAAWQAFFDELAVWRDAGRSVDFWWRDDDANHPDPALQQLLALAESHATPLALAMIPEDLQPEVIGTSPHMVTVLQHGVDHRSRALPGGKKTEFPPHEPVPEALARLASGWSRLQAIDPARRVQVLVPPWNRLASPALATHLAQVGYVGLSTFGPRRSAQAAPGVALVNTHVDIIDWHGTRGFVGEDVALAQAVQHLQARRSGLADAQEATGWLTHHAVHDAASWVFMDRLLHSTRQREGVVWRDAHALFAPRGD